MASKEQIERPNSFRKADDQPQSVNKAELQILISSTEYIHEDIADMARKYLNQSDGEEESLLIDNSAKK